MLTKKQIKEIREHLDKAQNPLFFFDNDSDGLCAFLLLQRFAEKGKGIPIRSFPELTEEYFKRVQELNADYIFILDKPVVSDEFFNKAREFNIPVVCIDHHEIDRKIPEFVNYYNPLLNKSKSNEPTTYLCYQISQKKEDLWLAGLGSISDVFVPEFYPGIVGKYPDITIDSDNAFDIRYNSQFGRIINFFSFALKDRITNVVIMMKFLMKVKSPYDVLEESKENYTMYKRFNEINSKYQRLLEKAKKEVSGKFLFFRYSGDLSISADLADELCYLFPEKIIVVAYDSGVKVNISARGKNVREIILKAISDLKDSTGGGHEEAVGAKIRVGDLEKFRKKLENLI